MKGHDKVGVVSNESSAGDEVSGNGDLENSEKRESGKSPSERDVSVESEGSTTEKLEESRNFQHGFAGHGILDQDSEGVSGHGALGNSMQENSDLVQDKEMEHPRPDINQELNSGHQDIGHRLDSSVGVSSQDVNRSSGISTVSAGTDSSQLEQDSGEVGVWDESNQADVPVQTRRVQTGLRQVRTESNQDRTSIKSGQTRVRTRTEPELGQVRTTGLSQIRALRTRPTPAVTESGQTREVRSRPFPATTESGQIQAVRTQPAPAKSGQTTRAVRTRSVPVLDTTESGQTREVSTRLPHTGQTTRAVRTRPALDTTESGQTTRAVRTRPALDTTESGQTTQAIRTRLNQADTEFEPAVSDLSQNESEVGEGGEYSVMEEEELLGRSKSLGKASLGKRTRAPPNSRRKNSSSASGKYSSLSRDTNSNIYPY